MVAGSIMPLLTVLAAISDIACDTQQDQTVLLL